MNAAAGQRTMPDRSWQGVHRVAVVVEMRSFGIGTFDPADLARDLCARVVRIAAEGAPYPVDGVQAGPAMAADLDTAVLAVHASIEQHGGETPRLVLALRRTMQAGLEPAPMLFGAAPRTAPLGEGPADSTALDATIAAALGEILPWRRQ